MSSYPYPPTHAFNVPSNYLQQWPYPPPSSAAPANQPDTFDRGHSFHSHQTQNNPATPVEYNEVHNFQANPRIPGLNAHGSPTPFPPPPFPYMSHPSPSQHPQTSFPVQMPPLAYPPMPTPGPYPMRQSSADGTGFNLGSSSAFASQASTTFGPRQDGDREDGEVTDREGGRPQSRGADFAAGAYSSRSYDGQNSLGMGLHAPEDATATGFGSRDSQQFKANTSEAPARTMPDIEEGEASSMSSSSTRDSGSPYNPPVSVSAEPYDPRRPSDSEIHDPQYHADEAPNESAAQSGQPFPRESQVDSDKKLPSQLRVQAQGALLGLAPHNIRYNELVGEGINPATLRRLYEEVGIRVGTPQPDTALTSKVISSLSDTSPISVHSPDLPTNQPGSLASSNVSQAKQASVVPLNGEASQQSERVKSVNGARPISAQAEASKPLERKELIARMLAAKAAKSAGDTSSSKADAGEGPLMVSNTDTNDIDKTTSGLSSPEEACKAKDTRTKEKNRAQTELARQRIEQLKKQGLMRSQSRPQADSAFQAASLQTSTVDQPPTTPGTTSAVDQHPLPDRPPDPEPEPIAHLPGLFMIPSAQGSLNESYSMSDYNHSVGSAPYSRAGQRKRPRASDFDEPTILPKKPFSPGAGATGSGDRLVIDISDDEFYGDDEHDIDMGTPADKVPDASSSIAPSEPKVPSHRKFPLLADTLPPKPTNSVNSRNSASTTPQAWKTADEENLRKKDLAIREMHRKIAELEQRKKQKLPESPTQSLRVLDSPASSMDVEQAASANHPGSKALEDISRGQSAEQFASMDSGQLERLRSKLLRKKEIEAGLPSLDDEIIRSETRLSDFKKEEERLLLELTKGKEGRRQLMEELKALDLEVNELSFQDVEVAGHGRQAVDKPSDNVSGLAPPSSHTVGPEVSLMPPTHEQNILPSRSADGPAEPQQKFPANSADTDRTAEPEQAASPSSVSVSESSAMDESSDSDNFEPSYVEQRVSRKSPDLEATNDEDLTDDKATRQEDTSYPSSENPRHPLPERPRFAGTESQADESGIQEQGSEDQDMDESSDASESYEPPEPDPSASVRSSPFSPPPPGPVEPGDSGPQLDQSHSDKQLTGNAQDSDSREILQVGPLDNQPRTDEPGRKFTPYSSPLKYFKAYRYHPRYADDVSDGYRSLTYSHNIDAMKYLCPFEAAGGVCNDQSCEFQHFRDMNLSDDKVLIQMGSLREGKNPEEKDRYIAGLKQIINDMRRDSVKDFISVAREIAAYRRRFLEDPSRVLPL